MRNTILLFLILIFTLSFCKGGKKSENVLNGAGATFPYPVYSAWAQDFEKSSQIKLNYQSIGSGGG